MSHAHTAGDRFRSGYRRTLAVGFAFSVVAHAILALANPPLRVLLGAGATRATEVVRLAPLETAFDPPPEVELPTRRQAILRPARPIPLARPTAGPPEIIPYDIAPLLENGAAVTALIRDRFPPDLVLTETEPSVLLWLFVDQSGRVTRLQLASSSGYAPLDALAEMAAREMTFRPAIHAGKAVAVWVAQRIRFTREIEGEAEGETSSRSERSASRSPSDGRRRGPAAWIHRSGAAAPSLPGVTHAHQGLWIRLKEGLIQQVAFLEAHGPAVNQTHDGTQRGTPFTVSLQLAAEERLLASLEPVLEIAGR